MRMTLNESATELLEGLKTRNTARPANRKRKVRQAIQLADQPHKPTETKAVFTTY
jgi:hypothetical protein